MQSETSLKQTPLYLEHLKAGARLVAFGGWEMPVHYEGILAEYTHTRRAVSVFDTCHMGEFIIEGDCQQCGLDRIVTHRIKDMPAKSCRYGLMLNEEGGVMDDLIVYRIRQDQWMIVVNGATTEKDARHFRGHLTGKAIFKNISHEIGKLDIQGPLARDMLRSLIPGIERLDYYGFDDFNFLGQTSVVSRTGYTGELGYEVYFPREGMIKLWQKILEDRRVKPAGLGARDVLRLEMCYSLYGNELNEVLSPLEAGLNKFVDFEKDFIGREALLGKKKAGIKRKLIYFTSETRQSPRHNHKIYSRDSREIGIVTSGSFSPALNRGIGAGFVAMEFDLREGQFFFGDEKNKVAAQIASRPFYKGGSLKN